MESDSTAADKLRNLFDQHHQRLFKLARRFASGSAGGAGSDEAQDLVQETFLRAAGRLSSVPTGPEAERAWLVRVMVNLCRDRDRRQRVRLRERARLAPPAASSPSHEGATVARQAVQQALARLGAKRRAIVVLHELEEIPTSEIATMLGLSQITVRWHLSRARKQLLVELGVLYGRQVEGKEPSS
jgi:RNA polymerase sigma factor (sigma-70 family)